MAIYLGDTLQTRGPSAYDLAVAGGYTGTEAEFNESLSLLDDLEANASKVKQENSTTDADYRIILSHTANDTTEINTVLKSVNFKANPSTGELKATKFSGDGSELTNLNGSNISSGTIPYLRLPVGTGASEVAQGNHTHGYASVGSETPASVGSSNVVGVSTTAARADHVHALAKATVTDALGYTPPTVDTKNTAGSTDSSSKIYLIGATSQDTNPQTYSQDTAYVNTDGHLYSNDIQVVNLSDTQALTNKTYNGYTLGAACAKAVDSSISSSSSTNLPTSAAVASYVDQAISENVSGGGGVVISNTAPENTEMLWIDTNAVSTQGLVAKVYYNNNWQIITGLGLWG